MIVEVASRQEADAAVEELCQGGCDVLGREPDGSMTLLANATALEVGFRAPARVVLYQTDADGKRKAMCEVDNVRLTAELARVATVGATGVYMIPVELVCGTASADERTRGFPGWFGPRYTNGDPILVTPTRDVGVRRAMRLVLSGDALVPFIPLPLDPPTALQEPVTGTVHRTRTWPWGVYLLVQGARGPAVWRRWWLMGRYHKRAVSNAEQKCKFHGLPAANEQEAPGHNGDFARISDAPAPAGGVIVWTSSDPNKPGWPVPEAARAFPAALMDNGAVLFAVPNAAGTATERLAFSTRERPWAPAAWMPALTGGERVLVRQILPIQIAASAFLGDPKYAAVLVCDETSFVFDSANNVAHAIPTPRDSRMFLWAAQDADSRLRIGWVDGRSGRVTTTVCTVPMPRPAWEPAHLGLRAPHAVLCRNGRFVLMRACAPTNEGQLVREDIPLLRMVQMLVSRVDADLYVQMDLAADLCNPVSEVLRFYDQGVPPRAKRRNQSVRVHNITDFTVRRAQAAMDSTDRARMCVLLCTSFSVYAQALTTVLSSERGPCIRAWLASLVQPDATVTEPAWDSRIPSDGRWWPVRVPGVLRQHLLRDRDTGRVCGVYLAGGRPACHAGGDTLNSLPFYRVAHLVRALAAGRPVHTVNTDAATDCVRVPAGQFVSALVPVDGGVPRIGSCTGTDIVLADGDGTALTFDKQRADEIAALRSVLAS